MVLDRQRRLGPGYHADITVFDPDKVLDKATYTQPFQYSDGIAHVIVNGVVTLENGKHTGAKAGRGVRRR